MNFKCNSKCNKCCHFRKNPELDFKDEFEFKKYMLTKFGVFYIYSMRNFSISIWPDEKTILEQKAKEKNVTLKIIPKRIVYDKKTKMNVILDYSIDADVCPFLNEKEKDGKGCMIYNERPRVCRAFPILRKINDKLLFGKCDFVDKNVEYEDLLKEIDIQEQMLEKEREFIKKNMEPEYNSVINTGQLIDFLDFSKLISSEK